ncbi:hypothetical protein PF001_g26536 [Phytophthora fragariae]|nr:hypothetical protein PF001_g26536 [Phytophthora fragariae]
MSKAGAKPRGILAYLRSKTGKRTILRDVHNMIQDAKKCFKGGRSDAERAVSVLDEFCEMNNGNVADNANRYKLFSFAVHDVFGKGQFVQHALLSNYAFDMVAHQYKLAVGSQACYDMETTPEGKARVTNPAAGNSHVVDARLAACDCIFR